MVYMDSFLKKEMYFSINILQTTLPLSIPPYKMALEKMRKLKVRWKYFCFIQPRIKSRVEIVMFVLKMMDLYELVLTIEI